MLAFIDHEPGIECTTFQDRILFKGNNLDLTVYSRAELKSSDHRPG